MTRWRAGVTEAFVNASGPNAVRHTTVWHVAVTACSFVASAVLLPVRRDVCRGAHAHVCVADESRGGCAVMRSDLASSH